MGDIQSKINDLRERFVETHDLFFEADPKPKIDYEEFEEVRMEFHDTMGEVCEDNPLKIEFEKNGRSGFLVEQPNWFYNRTMFMAITPDNVIKGCDIRSISQIKVK